MYVQELQKKQEAQPPAVAAPVDTKIITEETAKPAKKAAAKKKTT
jgi:hypothetical protein